MTRGLPWAIGAALLAALGAAAVCSVPVVLTPGSPAWRSSVRGAADGRLRQRSVALLPGLDRSAPRRLLIRVAPGEDAIAVAVDGGPIRPARVPREGLLVTLPTASMPGLRLDLDAAPGAAEPPRVVLLDVAGGARPAGAPALFAFVVTLGLGLWLARVLDGRVAAAASLACAATLAISSTPALAWLALPATGGRLALALLPLVPASLLALRCGPRERRLIGHCAGLFACLVFGASLRGYFVASAGSWDMEYWKAWTARAVSHGVAGVYGGRDAVAAGDFLAQLRGEQELWRISWHGRSFFVDYPPLAMALWRWSFLAVTWGEPRLDPAEAANVAAKLPAVLGDVLAWPLLLYVLRRRPLRGLWCGALYWALPVSWLSSGVLGFLDGACAPLLVLAVAAAGEGRATLAGASLALACLIKPTGVVVAPAMVVALLQARASLTRSIVAGLAVVATALAPFAAAGTLSTAVVHVYRILFQERLSGGFPNPWWLAGHLLTLGPEGLSAAVQYARVELLPVPARAVGGVLFAAAAAWIVSRQRGSPGAAPALLSAGGLFFAYAILAVGVHENHPHPLFLLLLAAGLVTPMQRALWAGLGASYVLNMLLVSGLGRFHGPRHAALEPLAASLRAWRLAPGFDATLLLAALNLVLFGLMLVRLPRELRALKSA